MLDYNRSVVVRYLFPIAFLQQQYDFGCFPLAGDLFCLYDFVSVVRTTSSSPKIFILSLFIPFGPGALFFSNFWLYTVLLPPLPTVFVLCLVFFPLFHYFYLPVHPYDIVPCKTQWRFVLLLCQMLLSDPPSFPLPPLIPFSLHFFLRSTFLQYCCKGEGLQLSKFV